MIRNSAFGPRLVREYNELNILRFIKNEGPISRADIAKRYKISKAAVSEIIAQLLEQEYISEIGVGNSTSLGGRKPILLEFNSKSGYAFGIEIKRDAARVSLADLNANIHKNKMLQFKEHTKPQTILELIFKVIEEFQSIAWVRKAKPTGIGVAIPGVINYRAGKIQESDTLKEWQGFPLRQTFEDRFQIETIIENDVKATSLAESRFGAGKGVNNQIYLWIGDGLGAGIILNGELYRGITAGAGEIGYLEPGYFIRETKAFSHLYKGQKNFGGLLSEKVLLNAARDLLKKPSLDMKSFLEFVQTKNSDANLLIQEYARLVSLLCINMIHMLNPELILIGGHDLAHNRELIKSIKAGITDTVLKTPSKAVHIKSASLRENSGILGSIALILEDIFYMERLNIVRYRDVFGFKR